MNHISQKKYILIAAAVISLLSIFAYSNTFKGEFQFDDDTSVAENPYVKNISKFLDPNSLSLLGGSRPVTNLTFAINYSFGGTDVRWYHLTNFLVHILTGILIFYFVFLTLNSSKLSHLEHNRASTVALISAGIFLLHPIQTEAVSYVSQRYESLASLFYLCSLIAYIKARLTLFLSLPPRGGWMGGRAAATRYTLYSLSVISGLLALGSKEIAITIPFVIFLYDFYFLPDRPLLKRIAGPGVFVAIAFIAGIVILSRLKGIDVGFSVQKFTPWEYLLTQLRVITTYIRLLFLPINQNLDYDFRISRSLFEVDTALSLIFLISVVIFAIAVFKRWKIGSFFILWFFIILAPTSSVIPVVDVIFEHRVYLASAGVFIVMSDILSRLILSKNPPVSPFLKGGEGGLLLSLKWKSIFNKISVAAMIVVFILLAATTFQRNKVWQTKLSLWTDAAKKSPMKSRVHNNLGNCYMLLNRYFEAIEEYKKAIALDKNNIEAYYNLALNLENVGLLKQAIYYYDIFHKLAPPQYSEQKKAASKIIENFYGGAKTAK